MTSLALVEKTKKSFEEKRGLRHDRRIREERRAGRDPYYLGEVRRFIIDRRMGTEDRRAEDESLEIS